MARLVTSVYRHTQSTPSTLWTVAHNLSGSGSQGVPAVDVIVDYNGTRTKMMPDEITIVDKDTLTISFSVAQSGTAIIIV
jgi:3-oxoacyl-ACP reductase-like protein